MQGVQCKRFLWSIYFDFLLFCFVVICDLVHTLETVHGIMLTANVANVVSYPYENYSKTTAVL